MPGFWDVHTHYGGTYCSKLNVGTNSKFPSGYAPSKYVAFACAVQMLRETLCAGVTSVREMGGLYGQELHQLATSGLYPSPNFHYAGKFIGMTGGHTDEQYLPVTITRNDRDDMYEGVGALCDGVADCVRKTREQLRKRADVIKVMTSGGVLSAFDSPYDQQLSVEEVSAIVQEARRARRVVAAHAHGAPGIASAIASGVHTIEHGSCMNESLAISAKRARMVHVPTITICQTFNKSARPPEYDPLEWAKGVAILESNTNAVKVSIRVGLTIATGTDCPGNCAQVAQEAVSLHSLGMSELGAIESLTANGPLSLGALGMAPKSGRLAVGYDADIIGLSTSPLGNLSVLTDGGRISHIWKGGGLFKGPGRQVCDDAATNRPWEVEAFMPMPPEW